MKWKTTIESSSITLGSRTFFKNEIVLDESIAKAYPDVFKEVKEVFEKTKYNIFQIFYNDYTKEMVNSAFTPYDNTIPVKEKEFEYGVMRNLYLNKELFKDDKEYAGVLSWKFRQKTGLDGKQIIRWMEDNKGYDVYFINPWPEHSYLSFNVWHQGEFYHPGMLFLIEKLFREAKLDIEIRNTHRNTIHTLCFCNYWIANKKFWNVYMKYCEQLYAAIQNTDKETKRLLYDIKADAQIDSAFFAFVMERMFSTVLSIKKFKTLNYFDIYTRPTNNIVLKNILDKYSPTIDKMDDAKNYTKDNIEFINSVGRLYHDQLFSRLKENTAYRCLR
jgi:hypothetical protein